MLKKIISYFKKFKDEYEKEIEKIRKNSSIVLPVNSDSYFESGICNNIDDNHDKLSFRNISIYHVSNYDLSQAYTNDTQSMKKMFYDSYFNQDLSKWNFSKIAKLENLCDMVYNSGLNQENYNKLVDAIYNTNSHGWTTAEIDNVIGTPITEVSYTGNN